MKTVPFTKTQIEKIIEKHPTPFHIYDEQALKARVGWLRDAFAWNEGYREYYAVKACPNPVILKIITDFGFGLDCASYAELQLAEAIGITGDRIMFSSNDTPAAEFRYARKLGATINLDDITHIDFLAENGGIPEQVSMRFNPGGEFKIGTAIMGNPGESKYGFTRAQLTEGAKKLMAMGAKRIGLHSFLASNNTDNAYYPTLAELMFRTAKELAEETGCEIFCVNLSGGVGIPARPETPPADIAEIGRRVEAEYHKAFDGTNIAPKVFTELGRFITGPIGYLVTTAIHHKDTYRHYIGVDACAVNLMRPAMYGAYHHITVMGKENAACDHVYDVTGSLCENNDKFAIERPLPEIVDGDILVIHDAGAHGFSMGYNYNGKLKSAELLLHEDGSVTMIRRPETTKDYFSTLDILGLPRLSEVDK